MAFWDSNRQCKHCPEFNDVYFDLDISPSMKTKYKFDCSSCGKENIYSLLVAVEGPVKIPEGATVAEPFE
ncbi:MAG: hypothetical protein ACIAZJ_26340 [Gimesia chilikensis]|uniref:hypothetical protein n=1 Tax=Gimesia chilikensis TaxID=2605989 RepID=UPI0037B41ABB